MVTATVEMPRKVVARKLTNGPEAHFGAFRRLFHQHREVDPAQAQAVIDHTFGIAGLYIEFADDDDADGDVSGPVQGQYMPRNRVRVSLNWS